MADETKKPIKDINRGEVVVGYRKGRFVKGRVLLKIKKESDIMEIRVDNNILHSTKDHEILTKKGFQRADSLQKGEDK